MKINKNYIQTFIFILVYLFAIYFWSQPYQERKLPYGEYDAMSHFEVGDYMAYSDQSLTYLPPYIDLRYGGDNNFKPHVLWYPPPFHTTLGVIQVFGGERIVPIFLLNTIMATFVIITVYFVINSLFGFLPAILSALLIIFSPRDFMPYIWGQWPERFAYAFIPIILYCFYKYFISYSRKDNKPIYLYLTSLFLGVNLLVHPLVFFHSIIGLTVLYVFLSVKQKKFVFNWKQISIAAIIFLTLFMIFPYQTFNLFPQLQATKGTDEIEESVGLSRLFQWSLNPKDYVGSVPASYFSFKEMHGLWTLPFLILGILFLILRRNERDLFLLAWLISLYFVLHRDLIGVTSFLHRSLSATQHIFAPLTALGAVYLFSFIKLPSKIGKYLKYVVAIVFVYLVFSINMTEASTILNKDTYNPYTQSGYFTALSDEQYQAGKWVLENVPESYNVSVLGIPHQSQFVSSTAKKIRWFAAVSQHVSRLYLLWDEESQQVQLKNNYIMLDYSMLVPLSNTEPFSSLIQEIQEFEKTKLINHTLVYDNNNIRIYKP